MTRWLRQPRYRLRQGGVDYPYEEVRVLNPSRGINLLVADILANDKEATAGTKNIEYAEGGVATKRPGYTAQGTGLTNPGGGLGRYTSEASNYPIASDGGVLKKFQSNVWSALPNTAVLDSTASISFTALFQKTYAWDGVNGGVVFDGTTVTRPGTMPRAKFSVTYKGYHVAAGVDGQPFRVYFAKSSEPSRFTDSVVPTGDDIGLNDATNVPGATVFAGAAGPRAIDINKNDGQKVTGLGFFQDVLIVFKEESIYQLYFNDTNGFVVERISSSYGAVCHGAIASVENDCYFLTDKGVYVLGNEPNYYASIRTNELSSRIRTLLQSITNWDKCRAIYHDDRYWLTAPINSEDVNQLIVYDRRFYSWAVWDNIYATDLMAFKDKDNDGKKHFYFLDDRTPDMQEFIWGSYSDNGEPISQVFVTRAFEGKKIDREKYWYALRPIFRRTTGDVSITYTTENGSEGKPVRLTTNIPGGLGVDQIGSVLFGASQPDTYTLADLGISGGDSSSSSSTDSATSVYDVGVGLDARTLKIEFRNENLNEYFTLLGWVLLYQTKDHERFDGDFTFW
jgi:hypothetical protein